MAFENFPYANFHELNLDWIVARVKEAYSASNPPDYPVKSVNGMTGDVIIAIPSALVRTVNGESGDVILYRNPLVQFPTTDESRWNLFRICDGNSGDARGIEFDEDGAHRIEGVRRILIYDEENQPDYPVTSVNGMTGDVRISAGVNSVNGKTGNVVTPFVNPNSDILKLDSNSNTVLWGLARDVSGGEIALYITRGTGTPQAFIRYTPTGGQAINLPLLSSADIPAEAGVVSINTKTGVVTIYGSDILTTENGNTIAQDIGDLKNADAQIYEGLQFSENDFEKGGITGQNVNDAYRNACRCRSINTMIYPFDIEMRTIADHTAFNVFLLDASGAYVSDTGWKTSYTIPKDTKFRFMIDGLYQAASATLTVSEILAKISTSNVNLNDLKEQIDNISESEIYVNIKDYGAVGDGVTDDTRSIQNAFEALKTIGGTIFAPAGTYLINSVLFDTDNADRASSLHIYSNCRFLMDENAVLKRGANTTRVLYTHNESSATGYTGCKNIVFEGGTFDANAELNENSGMLYLSHGENLTVKNCQFINSKGVWHAIECNSSRNVKIQNCIFETDATNGAIDIDAAHSSGNIGANDDTVCYNVEIENCHFTTKWKPAIQNHTQFAQHNIRIHDNVFYMRASESTPAVISFASSVTKVDVYNNTFYNTSPNVGGTSFALATADLTSLFHDNRVEGYTLLYPTDNCKGFNNILNGIVLNDDITALQAGQATQDQQITALQASQAIQDQQITALQNDDNTHTQQILELYTRTGIYAVSIPNANTLPLRYPASGTDEKIKATNKVMAIDLYMPGVQTSNWTVTTYDGYLEITGSMNGESDITLYLA